MVWSVCVLAARLSAHPPQDTQFTIATTLVPVYLDTQLDKRYVWQYTRWLTGGMGSLLHASSWLLVDVAPPPPGIPLPLCCSTHRRRSVLSLSVPKPEA
jgi:hypothetical protein